MKLSNNKHMHNFLGCSESRHRNKHPPEYFMEPLRVKKFYGTFAALFTHFELGNITTV